MPNWCENILTSSISLEPYINEAGEFDFELIKPTPEIFKNLPLPCLVDKDIEKLREKGDIVEYNKYHLYIIIEKQTGARDLLDWCLKNWGVKWNASHMWSSNDKMTVGFLTPWNPPIKIINELARLNPTAEFDLKFAEPGMGFCGHIKYDGNGNFINEEFDINDEKGKQIALEVLGEEFFEDNQ